MDDCVPETRQHTNELEEELEKLQIRNKELQDDISYLKHENSRYKERYNELKQQILAVNKMVEGTAHIFYEMFGDMKNALQMGRLSITNSPLPPPQKEVSVPRKKSSPKPGPSGVSAPQRKIHIERLDLEELQTSVENEEEKAAQEDHMKNGQLSTILEEKSAIETIKNLHVSLIRLPSDVIQQHLKKQVPADSSLDISATSSTSSHPEYTSTPLKLETMKTLGLYPSILKRQNDGFINTRKKKMEQNPPIKTEELDSPKKKKRKKAKTSRSKATKNELEEDSNKSRRITPQRKVSPNDLREPSLKKKVRRA